MKSRLSFSRLGSLSLRTQLVLLTSMLIALAISVMSLVAISSIRAQMLDQLDDEIKASYSYLVAAVYSDQQISQTQGTFIPYEAYLLDSDGNTVRPVATLDDQSASPVISGLTASVVERYGQKAITVRSSSGHSEWRLIAFPVEETQQTLVIAAPLNQINDTVAIVGLLTMFFGGATLLASIALTWVIVTRAFEPLARVEQTAAQIAAGDLSQRIENYSPYNELGHLTTSLNTMLSHIEAAFDAQKHSEVKMRRFVGDASHELRTPLVSIRGYSELYRMGGLPNDEAISMAMSRIESEAQRMGRLVEDLLTLARLDERRYNESTRIDLLTLAQDAANDAFATAPDRDIDVIGLDGAEGQSAPVWGDEQRLRQVLANLMTNALRYTPEGSPIQLAVGSTPGADGTWTSVLEVRDHGPGIHGEDAQRVFERFYRADTSRTRETGGTGLGLAIVAAIVGQHDGTVRVQETQGGGATFVIRLPQYSGQPQTAPAVTA
ncbi:MAG: ATP-binding protein [Rothia sp. (in: high G+C Gram-positive bacteria)]|nr:ATP-binding protein [Rothia sp. (in: high G+C Gram-positive bacteria)]